MKTPRILLFAVLLLGFSCKTVNKTAQKPNVLFLFTDDYSYRAVHALGNKQVITPNIDQLMADGTTLTHAYNMGSWSGAVCTASRSMLVSGMSVWRTNEHREKWNQKDSLARMTTWPKLMEQAGYETYMSGKWHVDIPAENVFNHTAHIRHGMPKDAFDHAKMMKRFDTEVATGKKTFAEVMPNGYNRPLAEDDNSWSPTDTAKGGYWEGGKHWSEVLKDDAFGFIDEAAKKDKPFFMYLAFNAAHDPRQSPQKYIDMYPLEKIELPENFQADYPYHEEIGVGPRLRDEALAPFPRTELAIKTHLQEYYAIITHMDEQIGLILKELEAKGLRENTLIFLTADHGLAIGRHGLLGKQNMYDHSMRVPLLVAGPGIPKGKKVEKDVFLQDIMASSIDAAELKKPDFVEFNSFLPLVKNTNEKGSLESGVYGAYLDLQRMIRKDGYKLIVYPKVNKVLLFDMDNDPEEMNNLAEDSAHKAKVKMLFEDLIKLQKHYADPLDLRKFRL
jgi:arylsulfatase A-like enzyme